MKRLLISAAVLVLTSTAALAWTDGAGHWVEGPGPNYGPNFQYGVPVPYGYPYGQYDGQYGYYPVSPPVVIIAPPVIRFGISPRGRFFFGVGGW